MTLDKLHDLSEFHFPGHKLGRIIFMLEFFVMRT